MSSLVFCSGIIRKYGDEMVLKGVDWRLPEKGLIGLFGRSGSGKSTLLHVLAGLDRDFSGRYVFQGRDMSKLSESECASLRLQNMGYVIQQDSLLDLEDAEENVLLPALAVCKKSKALQARARSLLFSVGLKGKARQRVSTLSGGERQRVALARALMMDPPLLLCDEPTGALDRKNGEMVFSLLRRAAKDRLVIVASHDEALLEAFCDERYRMCDGRLEKVESITQAKPLGGLGLERLETAHSPRLPFPFLFGHALRRRKQKRLRSFLSESAISLALIGIGMTVYLSSSISGQMQDAFSSIVPQNVLASAPVSEIEPLANLRPSSSDAAEEFASENPDVVSFWGKTLLYDFESSFTDENEFVYSHGLKQSRLVGFSARSINDFLLCQEGGPFYPSPPKEMEWSEVILGIPYPTMAKACGDFGLARGYEALGKFCSTRSWVLSFLLERLDWNFSEQVGFTVIGVCPSDIPCFYHISPNWNQQVFLDYLHFEDVGNDTPENPQETQTLPFLFLSASPSIVVRRAREKGHRTLRFDRPNGTYLPSICPLGEACLLPRLYCFEADPSPYSETLAESISQKEEGILGYFPVSSGGYYAHPDSTVSGFSGRFFLCQKLETAQMLSEAYGDLSIEEAGAAMEIPPHVVDGSLWASGPNQLRLSCDLSGLPETSSMTMGSCYLSKNLYQEWDDPSEIYVCAEIASEEQNGRYLRDFSIAPLQVLGFKKEDRPTLFVPSHWNEDFYLDYLNASPLRLEPQGCCFTLSSDADGAKIASMLSSQNPSFRFSCLSQVVVSSLSQTLHYLSSVLWAFSFVSFAVGASVFVLVISLAVGENKKEAGLLYLLGVSRKDVLRLYQVSCLQYAGEALLGAWVSLLGVEVFVSFFLSRSFGAAFRLHFSAPPYWACFLCALFFLSCISLFLRLYFSRANFAKRSK